MIARLRGTPAGRSADGLLLDVNGVGYLVAATPSVLRRAESGGEVTVETYLHVREDALQLYGFGDAAERELFTHLLTVAGIGPKVASRMILELGGKLAPPAETSGAPAGTPAPAPSAAVDAQVVEALVGLGWPEKAAAGAVDRLRTGAR